jgi:hypothetical protein
VSELELAESPKALKIKELHGWLFTNLAIAAETNEFEVSMRVDEIGSDTFWEAVETRLRGLS